MIVKSILNVMFKIWPGQVNEWMNEYNDSNEMISLDEAYQYVADNYDPYH